MARYCEPTRDPGGLQHNTILAAVSGIVWLKMVGKSHRLRFALVAKATMTTSKSNVVKCLTLCSTGWLLVCKVLSGHAN